MDYGHHYAHFNASEYDYDYNYTSWNGSNGSIPADFDSSSDWCEADERQERIIRMFQTAVFCVIFPLGVAGNCLVIATFALYRRLRLRSTTDVFLFHLALADLLLLLTLPLQAVDTHLGWVFPAALCKALRACYAVNTYSGLLLLACVSVDRYMVVARAQDMLRLRGRILTGGKVAAVAVWLAAALLSLPEILYSGVSGSGSDAYCGMQAGWRVKMAAYGAVIAVFCLSLAVMVGCYGAIARVLCAGHARRRGKQWHRQRTLKLMVALVLLFLLFQLPYTAVLSRKMAGQFCGLLPEYVTCTLAFTRCCLNPVLYALVGVRFRRDVLRLLHDSGCARGLRLAAPSLGSTSTSPTSLPPTSPASDAPSTAKFHFPTVKRTD
ncbi:C-C chemokine receptor type 10 [Salarias fasciatus]|uniref:C-C chemokine receptor type 10 n=1 Tax=Salarias fasciatus TaxID=181472 RepID=UPI0011768892|nr:C-C chemokine receptor type 7-like [Salarias fasciatus]